MNKENKAAYRREQRFQRKLLAYWQQQTPFVLQPSPALKPHLLTFLYLLSQVNIPSKVDPTIQAALILSVYCQSGIVQPQQFNSTLAEPTPIQSTHITTTHQSLVRNINYHNVSVMAQSKRRSSRSARRKNKGKSKNKKTKPAITVKQNKTKVSTPDISHILIDELVAVTTNAVDKYGLEKALQIKRQQQQRIFAMIQNLRKKSTSDQQWIDTALMSPGFQFIFEPLEVIQTEHDQSTRGMYHSVGHAIILPLGLDLIENDFLAEDTLRHELWHLWNCEKRQLLGRSNACAGSFVEPFTGNEGDRYFDYEQKIVATGENRILKCLPELIGKYRKNQLSQAERIEFKKYHEGTEYFQPKIYEYPLDQATIDNLMQTQRIDSNFKVLTPFMLDLGGNKLFNITVNLKVTGIRRDDPKYKYLARGNPYAPGYGEFSLLIGGVAHEKADFTGSSCDIAPTERSRQICRVTERDANHVIEYDPRLRDVFFPEHVAYHHKTIAKCYRIARRNHQQRQQQASESAGIATAKSNILTS